VAEQERPPPEEDDAPVEGPVTADGTRPVAALPPVEQRDDDTDEPEAAERDDEDARDEAEDAETDEERAGEPGGAEQLPPAAVSPTNGAPPAGAERPAIPRPSTAAGVAGAGGAAPATGPGGTVPPPQGAPAPAANRAAPAAPLRAATPSASPRRAPTAPPRRPLPPAAPERHPGRRWGIAGGIAAVVVALGVFAATQLLGGDESSPDPNRAAAPSPAATEDAAGGTEAPTGRADTTVAVFNGTTVNGLAASTADKLQSSGYKRGSTGDFTDQQRASSTIFYRREARRQARDIGRELDISELRVMDAETQALAGERAAVAVVVGSDKAP
jgi:hypothetical protein